MSYIVFILILL